MRILHILEAAHGGTRRHILDLLPALQQCGAHCDLIYSPLRHAAFARDAQELEKRAIGVFSVPMARGWGGKRDAAALRLLRQHLRAHRYDIIHCHSTKAGMLGRLAKLAAARSTPVVYTPHCVAFDTGLPRPQRRAARMLEQWLAPLTAQFIAVARHEYSVLRRAGLLKHSRATVIYNGVDLDAFDALASRPPASVLQSPAVGCFGRLSAQKNQATLLRAWPQVLRAVPEAQLSFVGSGEEEAQLRALSERLKIADRVLWRGEREEARPLYREFDLIAQPSRWEGCPYSVLEAMAARRAIVAARAGGVPELLAPDAGVLLHPSGDAATLARHLVVVLQDEALRATLGAAARRRVEEKFRLETMVEKTLEVYREVMAV